MVKTIKFKISGMHCASCAMNIDGELEDTPGVKSASANYARQEAEVEYDTEKVSLEDLVAAVKRAGYGVDIKIEK